MVGTHCWICGKSFLAHMPPNVKPDVPVILHQNRDTAAHGVCSAECLIAAHLGTIAEKLGQ